jgi:hypothetical protein
VEFESYGSGWKQVLLNVHRQRNDCIFILRLAVDPERGQQGIAFSEHYDYLPMATTLVASTPTPLTPRTTSGRHWLSLSRRVRARVRGRVGPSLGARRGNALTAPTKSARSPGAVADRIMSVIPGRAPASNPSRVIAGAGGVSNAVHVVGESAGRVTGWSQARHRSRCVRSYLNRSRGRRARRSPGCTPVRSSARRGRSSTRRGAQLLPGSTVEAGPGAVRAGRGSRPRSVKHS